MTEHKIANQTPARTLRESFRLPAIFREKYRLLTKTSQPQLISFENEVSGVALPLRRPVTRPSGYLISFIACVLVPAFFCTIYLLFMATDQYVAEARFAVRKAQVGQQVGGDKASGALGALSATMGGGGGLADQEAHIIANYLRSRSAIDEIQKEVNIIEIYQRPEADFWARLKKDPSIEDLVDYWNGKVSAYVDGPSGVVTVTARAFRPDDAKRLVDAFVRVSERLANRLSERARRDAMLKSEEEVRRTEGMVRQTLVDLRLYRDQEGFITPLMEATSTSKLLAEAMSERIKLQSEYFVAIRALSSDAPSVQGLKARLEGIDGQIENLKSQLTSRSGASKTVSASLVRFEELELKRVFAEKMYSLAQDSLERARLRAEQQSIYVSVFVPAHLPQEARFPERFSMSLILAIGFLLLWSVGALTVAAVEDHNL